MRTKQRNWESAAARRLLKLAGNPPSVETAVAIVADRLLEDVSCPPTDLDAIKNRLNVKTFEPVNGLPIAGELRKDGDAFRIVYATSLSLGRRRFTLAHELAHAVFETTGPNCPRYGRELERICDMLASELLLPKQAFLDTGGAIIGPTKIVELAKTFQTSLMATALRCFRLVGLSVFEVSLGRLRWGYGAIRSEHDFRKNTSIFHSSIAQAMSGTSGSEIVFFQEKKQLLEWECIGGERRALFVLRPKVGKDANDGHPIETNPITKLFMELQR